MDKSGINKKIKSDNSNKMSHSPLRFSINKIQDDNIQTIALSLYNRYDFHNKAAITAQRRCNLAAYFFNLSIPLLSLFLTFIIDSASFSFPYKSFYISIISLVLSAFSILNTVFKPIEKYSFYSNTLVRLKEWEINFSCEIIERLEKINNLENTKDILEFLNVKNIELSEIGVAMANKWLPRMSNLPDLTPQKSKK